VTFAGLVLFGLISFGALQYALLQGKKTHLQGREDRLIALLNDLKEETHAGQREHRTEPSLRVA